MGTVAAIPMMGVLAVVALLGCGPGALLLRTIGSGDTQVDPARELSVAERAFLCLTLGLGLVAWVAITLAEVGAFRVGTIGGVIGVCCALRAGRMPWAGRRSIPGAAARHVRGQGLAVAALGTLSAVLFLPPFDTALWGSDATVHLNLARRIVRTGGLVFDDPVLAELPDGTRRAAFRNRLPRDVTGEYARFPGGFLIPDIDEPRVTAGFSPMLPVLLALADGVGGLPAARLVSPAFALLGVWALFFTGARLSGAGAGLLAAGLLAVSLPQIWFARFALPAVVAQAYVWAGVAALAMAADTGRRGLAAAAGGLVGLAAFAAFDLGVVVPTAVVASIAFALWMDRPGRGAVVAWFAAGVAMPLAHQVAHFALLPSHYGPFVTRMAGRSPVLQWLGASPPGVPGAVVLGAGLALAAVLLARRGGRRAWAGLLGVALVVYAANYLVTMQNRLADTIAWLAWSLSWPVVALGVAGAGLAVRRARRPGAAAVFVGCLLSTAALHYLYDPWDAGDQLWSMRRFLPVVIPGLLLLGATAAIAAVRRLGACDAGGGAGRRRLAAGVGGAVVVALVALVARPSLAVVGRSLRAGTFAQSARIAARFPEDARVAVSPGLAGTHLATSLTYLHDVAAVVAPSADQDPAALERLLTTWLEAGREVFVVVGDERPRLAAPRLAASLYHQTALELDVLETTRTRLPREVETRRLPVRIFRVTAPATPIAWIDIGTVDADLLVGGRGFHGPERHADPTRGAYRWSSGLASLLVPADAAIALRVDGWRPPGVAPATLAVWMGGRLVVPALTLDATPVTVTLRTPAPAAGATTRVVLRATTFSPRAAGLSDDDRRLGVRLYGVSVTAR